ncbi:unnamed protein product [Durusdinium trenchii]|uniref:Uncharacterized protein n=1 Tax=Durusdinium trenchii TaxID=1381693 RepID=A0ABP0J9T2_9DINO
MSLGVFFKYHDFFDFTDMSLGVFFKYHDFFDFTDMSLGVFFKYHDFFDFCGLLFFDYVPHGLYDAPADLEYMLSVGGCPCACAAASFRTLFANVLQSMLPATTLDAGVAESHL